MMTKKKCKMVPVQYRCGSCESADEKYRAIGNVPKYAHLCIACWVLSSEKSHYVKVSHDD
jgi:hypothetical protein